MDQSSKFLNITGEVVRRINNPEQVSKGGNKYSINYLVIKWVSGSGGNEFVDYVPIKVLEFKKIADLRAGYIVNVPVMYTCSIRTEEVKYTTRNSNGTMVEQPSLWPEFVLTKKAEIQIIDSTNNLEEHVDTNQNFKQNVIDTDSGPDDDLPF